MANTPQTRWEEIQSNTSTCRSWRLPYLWPDFQPRSLLYYNDLWQWRSWKFLHFVTCFAWQVCFYLKFVYLEYFTVHKGSTVDKETENITTGIRLFAVCSVVCHVLSIGHMTNNLFVMCTHSKNITHDKNTDSCRASCIFYTKEYHYLILTLLQNMLLFQAICPGCLWARDKRWLLSRVQRLAGPAGGIEAFCPGW